MNICVKAGSLRVRRNRFFSVSVYIGTGIAGYRTGTRYTIRTGMPHDTVRQFQKTWKGVEDVTVPVL